MKRSIVNILLAVIGAAVIVAIVLQVVGTRLRLLPRKTGRATRKFYRRIRPRWLAR